jgi:CheY-like chemotaxis protein
VFSGKRTSDPTEVSLASVVEELERMIRSLLGESIELSLQLDESEWWVCADRGQLEQVLMNLIVNARDAMTDGGRLTVRTDRITVRDSQAPVGAGDYVTLAVSDTGCGIAPRARARIFEPFFTTKEVGRGTGLGLSTVKSMVEDAGGAIELHSELGRGSTFVIYLPRTETSGAEAPVLPVVPRRGAETVLVVEDDALVRLTLRSQLEAVGYRVLVAGDGPRARSISEGHDGAIDLLISDVMLPGITGPELVRGLAERHAGARVIYTSAHPKADLVGSGRLTPDAVFLHKPFGEEELMTRLRSVLEEG